MWCAVEGFVSNAPDRGAIFAGFLDALPIKHARH